MTTTRFGAGKAFLAFLFPMLLQVSAVFKLLLPLLTLSLFMKSDTNFQSDLNQVAFPLGLLAMALATIPVIIFMVSEWARDAVVPLVRRIPPRRDLLLCALGATAIASAYFVVVRIFPPDPNMPLGTMAQLIRSGPLGRVVYALLALLIAPPVEELLYRGVILEGFRASWGMTAGAIVMTVLYASMQFFETYRYWPSIVLAFVIATAFVVIRIRTASLLAPLVTHVAFNAIVAGGILATA